MLLEFYSSTKLENVVPFLLKPTRRVTISTSITTTTQPKPTVPITNSPMKWQRPTPTCTSNSTRQITQQEVIRWGRLLSVALTNTMEAPLTQRVMRSARRRQQMASRLHPTLLRAGVCRRSGRFISANSNPARGPKINPNRPKINPTEYHHD